MRSTVLFDHAPPRGGSMPRSVSVLLQGFFGFASPAQDHEVVGVGHDPRAQALLQPEHLP
jgi:hypothetical protein